MGLRISDLPARVSHLAGLWGAKYISLPISLLGVGLAEVDPNCPGNGHCRVEGLSALASELAVYSSQPGLFFPFPARGGGGRYT